MKTETLPLEISKEDQVILYRYFVWKVLSLPSREVFELALEQNKSIEDSVAEAVRNESIIMVLKESIKDSKRKTKKKGKKQ